MKKRITLLCVAVASGLAVGGCSHVRNLTNREAPTPTASDGQQTPAEPGIHEAQVGKTEDELIMELGAPQKVEKHGSFTVYHYYSDHGIESRSFGAASLGTSSAFGGGRSRSKHRYQLSRFYLKDGKVVKWDYEEQ